MQLYSTTEGKNYRYLIMDYHGPHYMSGFTGKLGFLKSAVKFICFAWFVYCLHGR